MSTKEVKDSSLEKKSKKIAPAKKRTASLKNPQQNAPAVMQNAKDRLSLLALSPFRFPLDIEKLAVQSARIGGVAFVFFGILFSYHYLESAMTGIVEQAEHSAQVRTAVTSGSQQDRVDMTPDVAFSYEAGTDGYIIRFAVPHTEKLIVYAYEVQTGTYHMLGNAQQVGTNDWKYVWVTKNMNPGDYWIKALITNAHGVYDRSDSQFISVE